MGGWFETALVLLTVVFAALIGRGFSRLKTPHWGWGYVISLLLIVFLLISAHLNFRLSLPILAWATAGRARFVILGIAVTMGSFTLVGRLTKTVEKVIVLTMTLCITIWASIMPRKACVDLWANLSAYSQHIKLAPFGGCQTSNPAPKNTSK